jgi:hypothetical protein
MYLTKVYWRDSAVRQYIVTLINDSLMIVWLRAFVELNVPVVKMMVLSDDDVSDSEITER